MNGKSMLINDTKAYPSVQLEHITKIE
jgi:hypothetical protein